MRVRVRRALAAVAAMTVLMIGLPAGAAYSDEDRSCNDERPPGTPEFVQCVWLNRPEEARDVALFWLSGDGANMEGAQPGGGRWFRCDQATGDACLPADAQGDGGVHDGDAAAPGDYVEPEGTPTCDPPGTECYVDPGGGVTPEQAAEAARTPAGQAVAAATGVGLRPWIETELVDDWKAGERALAAEAARVAALAAQPGVAGIRFTTQLGYNGALRTPEEVRRFVTEASAALRRAAPGRRLAVHTVVPEFGCGTNTECVAAMRERYPLLVPADIEAYLKTGAVDQLNLDSGLFASAYQPWGISADQAAENQWIKVRALAWDALVQIGAEDAGFAGSRPLTADQAKALAADRVATPLRDGAATVTLWTRWQDGAGKVHRVLGERLATTPAWEQLTGLRPLQRRLATIYDPAAPEVSVAEDLKKLAEVFSQVYITA